MTKSLKASLRKGIVGIVMMTTIFSLSGVAALVPVAQAATIVDGDVIRNPSAAGDAQFDVYIVKIVGASKYKRLVLNPQVFESYGHLKWENVKTVTSEEMNQYKTSAMVRVETDPKVYALAPNGDTGSKSWLNVAAETYVAAGGAWDQVYVINAVDGANYAAATDLTTQAQVVTFLTTGVLPGGVVPPVTGAVTVSLAADSPAAGTLASSSAYNTMLKLNIANGSSSEVSVTGITVTRTGYSVDTNVAGVLVKDAAGARHGNVLTLSDAKAALSFAADPIKVAAGSSSAVSIMANLSSTATSGTIGFKVNAATDVTSSATVNGTFPLAGATFSLVDGSSILGGMSIQSQTISTSARAIDIGVTGQEIGKFKFTETSSKEAVNLNKVRFYNNGNTTDADLANIVLYNTNLGTVLATVASTTNKYVTFDLSASPLKFEKGTNKTLSVRADVVNGSTRTAQFIVQNDYDIEAAGVDTGSGVLATVVANTDDGNATTFPVGSTANFNTISVTAGSLTVSKDSSSPSGNIGQGQSGVVLGAWKLEAKGEDIQIQKAGIDLGTGTTVEGDFTGTVKLVISDSTIYSVAASTDTLWDASNPQSSLATYYTIKAGTSAIVKIVADTASAATDAATVQAEFGNVYYYKASSNAYATANATLIAANTLTVSTTGLTVAKNTAMGDSTVVAGQSGVKLGSYVMQAGSAEGVNVSTVNITLNSIDSSKLSNLKLFKGAVQIGSTVSSPIAGANAFSVGGSLTIVASGSATVDVYGDIATASTATFITSIAASGISANGTPSGTTISSVPAAAVTGQSITATASGTLFISTDSATPVQAILHADQTGVEVARFKLTGTVEPIKITKVVLESTNGSGNVQDVALWDGVTQVGTTSNLVDGKVTFSGLNLVVSKDSSKTFKVTVGTTPTGTMVSAQQAKLVLGSIEALGNSSGVTVYPTATTTAIRASSTTVANQASALEVTSTAGFSTGDLIYVEASTAGTTQDDFYLVNAVTDGDTLSIIGPTVIATATVGRVTKIATSATTTLTAVADECLITADTASACTVASTTGFAPGDVVYIDISASTGDAGEGGGFYVVDSITSATVLSVIGHAAIGNTTDQQAGKLTKVATTATTAIRASSTTVANQASALEVTSTAGFSTGDLIYVEASTAGTTEDDFYLVDAVTDSDTLSIIGPTVIATATVGRVTKIATSVTTTLSTTADSCLITADTASACTVASTTNFNDGDVVYIDISGSTGDAGEGGGFYVIDDITSSTVLSVIGHAAIGNTTTAQAGKVTKVWSSTSSSNPFYMHDVEPVITLASGYPFGTTTGSANQVVAKFSIKADGTRDLTIKSILITRGGSATTTEMPAASVPSLYVSGSSTSLGTGANTSWTTSTSGTSLITLTTPYTITAGDTVTFDVKCSTVAITTVNHTFQVLIDGVAGNAGNVSWYYDAAAPSPGTEPTNASPSTVSDTYPIYGGSLVY